MEPRSQPAVAGPVIFFGLIIYTMFAPEVDLTTYANPADVMDVGAISVPQAALFAVSGAARPLIDPLPNASCSDLGAMLRSTA